MHGKKKILKIGRIEIGIDAVDMTAMAAFWSKALDYKIGDLDRAGVYLDLIAPDEILPAVFLQKVEERSDTKNHVHIDIYTEDFESHLEKLIAIGASLKGGRQTGSEGGLWQVMTDIEGNEFCLCRIDHGEDIF